MYFEQRPVGWRDDERFMKILQAIGFKSRPEAIFESLAKLKKHADAYEGENRMIRSLRQSAMYQSMLGAVGGDTPDFLKEL